MKRYSTNRFGVKLSILWFSLLYMGHGHELGNSCISRCAMAPGDTKPSESILLTTQKCFFSVYMLRISNTCLLLRSMKMADDVPGYWNAFHVTGLLSVEFTGHLWIPLANRGWFVYNLINCYVRIIMQQFISYPHFSPDSNNKPTFSCNPFYQHGLTLVTAWISNCIH